MRVKCCICDKVETIKDSTPIAKRLINRPVHTYMCQTCNERIKTNTNKRKATGNFKLYQPAVENNKY